MNILNKEVFSEDDILEIINSRLEESINIEFKNANALSNDKNVKKEISKDITAFANSDGGIIFYGIDEKDHVANGLSFINGNIFTKEWLENTIISTIQQKIDNLRIFPVRFEDDFLKTIYVVKIPKSPNNPHINGDKKFYKRHNFQSVPMEEYEVRNSYLKERESLVYIEKVISEFIEENDTQYIFKIEVQIVNDGKFVSEKYKIGCDIKNACGLGIKYSEDNYSVTTKEPDGFKISTIKMVPLFPRELMNAMSFDIEIPKKEFDTIIENIKFIFFVFSKDTLQQDEMEVGKMLKELMEKI
ncbi:AlbA family DNA-binding domain-containing protein [Flavobacterium dankookense]|uniref:Putative DNA-binding protein n=1 Tax=Flavobacterium dankookense TaxID=706186 RepID=A0A4R6QDW4_9FLAO|nr:ATP-binding protein [Flavobacterium dankookense]TDP61044.1 putative DNA-binding protein [Flavobacterium dankookense]